MAVDAVGAAPRGLSRASLPVSTTHVSVGGIFGIGIATRTAKWGVIGQILLAWITTRPLGAGLAALTYWIVA